MRECLLLYQVLSFPFKSFPFSFPLPSDTYSHSRHFPVIAITIPIHSRMRGNTGTNWDSIKIYYLLPSSRIPIPISTFIPTQFPFPRESHGNHFPIGIPIPKHTSSLMARRHWGYKNTASKGKILRDSSAV